MTFHVTSENTRIERRHDGYYLVGDAQDQSGQYQHSEIRLDDYIGNDNGHFRWDGGGFSASAEDIRYNFEGGANQPVLRARLKDVQGNLHDSDINLAERIVNRNGRYEYYRG